MTDDKDAQIAALQARLAKAEGPTAKQIGQGCGCVVVLGVLAAILLLATCGKPKPDPLAAADAAMITQAKHQLRDKARDPDSVRFGEVVVSRNDGTPAVCGRYNAKNGFGGYVGERRFLSTGTAVLAEGSTDPVLFAPLWERFCGRL